MYKVRNQHSSLAFGAGDQTPLEGNAHPTPHHPALPTSKWWDLKIHSQGSRDLRIWRNLKSPESLSHWAASDNQSCLNQPILNLIVLLRWQKKSVGSWQGFTRVLFLICVEAVCLLTKVINVSFLSTVLHELTRMFSVKTFLSLQNTNSECVSILIYEALLCIACHKLKAESIFASVEG